MTTLLMAALLGQMGPTMENGWKVVGRPLSQGSYGQHPPKKRLAGTMSAPVGCPAPEVQMQIDNGTPIDAQLQFAKSVVRLRTEDFACTATLIEVREWTFLLSAAHCFATFSDDAMSGIAPRAIITVENGQARREFEITTEGLRLPEAFRACIARGSTFAACIASADDVALLPMPADGLMLENGELIPGWRLSRSNTQQPSPVALLGYGLDRGVPSEELLGATFVQEGEAPARGPVSFRAVEPHQQVSFGDSGGPGIDADEVATLATQAPCIWYVSSGINRETGIALLQPVAVQPALVAQ